MRALAKLTEVVDGEPRIVSDPPLIVPIEDIADRDRARGGRGVRPRRHPLLPAHARPPIGGGCSSATATCTRRARSSASAASATRAWIVLMLGRDDDDPLFLQLKEAQASVLEPFLGKSAFANHGQRVVEGQRLTQAASDILLGWIRLTGPGRREPRLLHPPALGRQGLGAGRADGPDGDGRSTPSSAARRSPRRTPAPGTRSRSRATSARGDSFDRAMASFAEAYADQNERDYDAVRAAVASGTRRGADGPLSRMEWSLAILARDAARRRGDLAAAVRHARHAGDGVRRRRRAARPRVLGEIDVESLERDRAHAGRGDAGARAVLRRLAHRPRASCAARRACRCACSGSGCR